MKSTDQQGMYGPKLTSCFRVAAGGCLTLDWPEKSTFAITRISSDIGLSDFTDTVQPGPRHAYGGSHQTDCRERF